MVASAHINVEKACKALRKGLVGYARAFAVTYHYALRGQSEAFKLTCDGACGGPHGWHSRITFVSGGAVMTLEGRKNVRGTSRVERVCCCNISPTVCGQCALRGAVCDVDGMLSDDAEARRPPVFQLGSISRARQVLRELSGGLGLGRMTWHGFRRGSATDLVAEGASLSKVLAWGAWRSASFCFIFPQTH